MNLSKWLVILSLVLLPLSTQAQDESFLDETLESLGAPQAEEEAPKPQVAPREYNVLLLMVDDLNDWVGCYDSNPNTKTPNIDAFARTATRFQTAVTPIPICNAARASMLTGVAPWKSGLYKNWPHFRDISNIGDLDTLPELFKENGYYAAMGGKIFHHSRGIFSDPRSWDEQSRISGGTGTPAIRFQHGFQNQLRGYFNRSFDFGAVETTKEQTADWRNAEWIVQKLVEEREEPFFLAYGAFRPHLPWYAPQEFFDMHPLEEIQLPPLIENDIDDLPKPGKRFTNNLNLHTAVTSTNQWKNAIQGYLACVSYVDACVGHVLNAVNSNTELRDNTIVILTSDHGWHLGEKKAWSKFKPWERSLRIPMLIRVPGLTTPGSVSKEPVSLLDIYPTVANLCGISTTHALDGDDITPLLADPDAVWRRVVVSAICSPETYSLRTRSFKLIRHREKVFELYNLNLDPNEWNNLAVGKPSARHRRFIQLLNTHVPSNPQVNQ